MLPVLPQLTQTMKFYCGDLLYVCAKSYSDYNEPNQTASNENKQNRARICNIYGIEAYLNIAAAEFTVLVTIYCFVFSSLALFISMYRLLLLSTNMPYSASCPCVGASGTEIEM